jgi:hypothetical protein
MQEITTESCLVNVLFVFVSQLQFPLKVNYIKIEMKSAV